MNKFVTVAEKNKNKYVHDHFEYSNNDSDFNMGFLEACDFFQYIICHFSISSAVELWPPSGEYEICKTYGISNIEDLERNKCLVWNHFWQKFKDCNNSPYLFYARLDYTNKELLYNWYKRSVKTSLNSI